MKKKINFVSNGLFWAFSLLPVASIIFLGNIWVGLLLALLYWVKHHKDKNRNPETDERKFVILGLLVPITIFVIMLFVSGFIEGFSQK